MKKYILSFVFFGFYLVLSCRSKEIITPTVANVDNSLLKEVSVKEATDVKINHYLGIIQVTLPESFSSKSIILDFLLGKNASLNFFPINNEAKSTPNIINPEKQTIEFSFEGAKPLGLDIQTATNQMTYKVYVNYTNRKLKVELDKIDSVSYYTNAEFSLKSISYAGTIPTNPNSKSPFVLLKKMGNTGGDTTFLNVINGKLYGAFELDRYIPFENQSFTIEYVEENNRQLLKENFKFLKGKAKVSILEVGSGSTLQYVSEINSGIKLYGGLFSPSKKYTLKFFNDFTNTNIQLEARVNDKNYLSIDSPVSLPSGSYLVDVYENDNLLNRVVANIGKNISTSGIRTFIKKWDNENGIIWIPDYSIKKEQFFAGDSLLILPIKFVSISGNQSTAEALQNIITPTLRLAKQNTEILLKPTPKFYGVGGIMRISFFQYTIPKYTESGFYEAQLVYPDGRESLKYWNKIEIQ